VEPSSGRPADVVQAVRWRWKVVAGVATLVFLASVLYAESLPDQYDGVAVVAVLPRSEAEFPGADYVSLATPSYVTYITAPRTLQRIGEDTDHPARELRNAVTANVVANTSNISITVRLPSARDAAIVANELADALVAYSASDDLLQARTVSHAVVPEQPAAPLRRLQEAAGLLAGVFLGVVAAVVLERRRPRVEDASDIAQLTSFPILASLPKAVVLRRSGGEGDDAASLPAVLALATSFDRQLDHASGAYVVTASRRLQGSTTVARTLASAAGRAGRPVLLVEADFSPVDGRRHWLKSRVFRSRRPDGSQTFAPEPLKANIRVPRPRASGTGVLTLPSSPDAVANRRMARRIPDLIRQAKGRFELVIVDAPPLLEPDGGQGMVTAADGVVLVVSSGTPIDDVAEALLALQALRARVVGIVGNRMR
jgi:Mrp family chromosome partitioning ATPase